MIQSMAVDPAMQTVIDRHLAYTGNMQMDQGIIIQGATFWIVGHNASHEFYLGVILVTMMRRSRKS